MTQPLHVQTYLRSGKSLEDLKNDHGINYHVQNGKISLSYNQILVRDADELSQQCRGLILRDQTFDVVAVPMFRFFNIEQTTIAAEIDWNTASIEEKLDGTLVIVYYDHVANRWFTATRSRPEADVPIDAYSFTFSNLFEMALQKLTKVSEMDLQVFMKSMNKNLTYCFELCTPLNRIVCAYGDFFVHLLAVRDNSSFQELDPKAFADRLGIPQPKTYSFSGLEDLLTIIRKWNPEEHEGVVVKDALFRRVKIKSPAYVAFNHIRDRLSTSIRGCVEIIILGKDDDVLHILPEFIVQRITKIKAALKTFLAKTQADYDAIKHLEDKKEFALAATKCAWPSALFALHQKKVSSLDEHILRHTESNSGLDTIYGFCRKIDPNLE